MGDKEIRVSWKRAPCRGTRFSSYCPVSQASCSQMSSAWWEAELSLLWFTHGLHPFHNFPPGALSKFWIWSSVPIVWFSYRTISPPSSTHGQKKISRKITSNLKKSKFHSKKVPFHFFMEKCHVCLFTKIKSFSIKFVIKGEEGSVAKFKKLTYSFFSEIKSTACFLICTIIRKKSKKKKTLIDMKDNININKII